RRPRRAACSLGGSAASAPAAAVPRELPQMPRPSRSRERASVCCASEAEPQIELGGACRLEPGHLPEVLLVVDVYVDGGEVFRIQNVREVRLQRERTVVLHPNVARELRVEQTRAGAGDAVAAGRAELAGRRRRERRRVEEIGEA